MEGGLGDGSLSHSALGSPDGSPQNPWPSLPQCSQSSGDRHGGTLSWAPSGSRLRAFDYLSEPLGEVPISQVSYRLVAKRPNLPGARHSLH